MDMSKISELLQNMNPEDMLASASAMQRDMKKKLEARIVQGESGGGLVKVTMNGLHKLLRVELDDSLINPDDKTILADLLVAAVNIATDKLKKEMEDIGVDGLWSSLMQ